ncbi:hypothetical protein Val02_03370 [Virgisporangium aliadipatigenens]|uniref:Oxidoreductase n=1 Tax=Virgisporangium aliadipatigenens TaxID=741659 RepID=A0A8J4DN49_9ACTN|nr:hypothetical protein [Virgisporangium aliadipatigenens]GIJ43451.1 hypothetical protein Val02_03370 [Virgisporangium aliadipatigenens]
MKRDRTLTWQPASRADLTGLNVAVVGGTGGIGRALSRSLAGRGARVLVVGRTFRDAGVPGIEFLRADLELLREAARVGTALPAETLDQVIFTSGIMAAPVREETAEGLERDLAVSYLSRFVILRGVADRLGTGRPAGSPRPRAFVMGFPGGGQAGDPADLNAERSYKAMAVHLNTVAANEALVLDAVRRYPHVDAFGLNPGWVKTGIRGNLLGDGSLKHRLLEAAISPLSISAGTYARRVAPLLVSPDLTGRSGAMFDNRGRAILASPGLTAERVAAFMAASAELVAVRQG